MIARVLQNAKLPTVVLEAEDGTCVLKAYPNADGTKIRIVLPELRSAAQCIGHIEGSVKYLEFTRKP